MLIRRNTLGFPSRTQVPIQFTCKAEQAPSRPSANQLSPRLSCPEEGVVLVDFCNAEAGASPGGSVLRPPGQKNAQNCARGVAAIPSPRCSAVNPHPDPGSSQPLGLRRMAPSASASDATPGATPASPSASSPVAAGRSFRRKAPAALLVQSRNARAADVSKELQGHSAPSSQRNSVCGPLSAPVHYRRNLLSPLSHPPRCVLPEAGLRADSPDSDLSTGKLVLGPSVQPSEEASQPGTTAAPLSFPRKARLDPWSLTSPGPSQPPALGAPAGARSLPGSSNSPGPLAHVAEDEACGIHDLPKLRFVDEQKGVSSGSPVAQGCGLTTGVPRRLRHVRTFSDGLHSTVDQSLPAQETARWTSGIPRASPCSPLGMVGSNRGAPTTLGASEVSIPARDGGKIDSPRAHNHKFGSPKDVERRGKLRLDPWGLSSGIHTGTGSAGHSGCSGTQGAGVPAGTQAGEENVPMAYPVDPSEVLSVLPCAPGSRTAATRESSSLSTQPSLLTECPTQSFPDISPLNVSPATQERFGATGRSRSSREQREGARFERGLLPVAGRCARNRELQGGPVPTLLLGSPKSTSSSAPELGARDTRPVAEASPSHGLLRRTSNKDPLASCSSSPQKSSLKAVTDAAAQTTQRPSPRRVSFSEDVRVRKFVPCENSSHYGKA